MINAGKSQNENFLRVVPSFCGGGGMYIGFINVFLGGAPFLKISVTSKNTPSFTLNIQNESFLFCTVIYELFISVRVYVGCVFLLVCECECD